MNYIAILFYLAVFSFLIITARNILYLIFLWQLKEYRLDRLLAYLKTSQGKKYIFGYLTVIKWLLFLNILFDVSLVEKSGIRFDGGIFYLLFWLVWILEATRSIREWMLYGWRLPRFTLKAVFILVVVFFITSFFLLDFNFTTTAVRILFLGPFVDRFSGILIGLIVGLLAIPSALYKRILISLAKRKMLNLSKLLVIGVTGSYGKTSTKEFLAVILEEKYKVVKTPEFTNTDIGIAKYILGKLKPDREVFIVEMGAYKKGEIEEICNMVKPKIGIITGINEQHLELFGSLENTIKTKFELIESLPKTGTAIFNGHNKYCLQMADWSKSRGLKTFVYDLQRDVKNIDVSTNHLEFTFVSKKKNHRVLVNLLGQQVIENLLAAIYIAKNQGLTWEEIRRGIAKIQPMTKTMQPAGKLNGMNFVDDSFNANPEGVNAAASFMKTFKGKKILVLTPLIELGEEAEKIHTRLGEELTKVCDLVLLTNFNYRKAFVDGAKKNSAGGKVRIVNSTSGVKLIKENLDKTGIVVFEGKEAGKILKALTKDV